MLIGSGIGYPYEQFTLGSQPQFGGIMSPQPVRDLNIIGDFIKYFFMLFIPLFLVGGIYGWLSHCLLLCALIDPLSYSIGIALIIIVIKHDINDIFTLIGLGKENRLSPEVKHSKTIQQISYFMGTSNFDAALKHVNALLKEEPQFTRALNMKAQILLEGFQKNEQARRCLNKVLQLSQPDEEQYKLADSLIMASYHSEDD